MRHEPDVSRHGERGSALVIALLVTVILTLLGISFLLMAETENRIAENERLSSQALYFGEAGAYQVKRWFDRPGSANNLINPPLAVIDRTLREIDEDGDPATAPHPQDGATWPRYKQGIDLDLDGNDDVFDKPYRDALVDTLLGTEDGPDMRIDETASTAARTFLMNLSSALLAGYPNAPGGTEGALARITRIDVYAPPYVNVGGTWTRYGMATVKVMARIYRVIGGTETVLAERMIKAVLNETPFPGPYGPLHSCNNLQMNGEFTVHWGTGSAVAVSVLPSNLKSKFPASLPRAVPPSPKVDLLWGWDNDPDFAAFKAKIEGDGLDIDDPWFRYLSGGPISGAPAPPVGCDNQPYHCPWSWAPGDTDMTDEEGEAPAHPLSALTGNVSGLMENMPSVTCPSFEYDTWKAIATSGESDVHYYAWSSGTMFKENGFGTAQSFRDITDNQEGLFFFDTKDGIAPHDDNGDGFADNLTDPIRLQGGTWGVRGFVYLNAQEFKSTGVTGRPATYRMPGEPFQDKNQNGRFDPGEAYINLAYPNTIGGTIRASATDNLQNDGTYVGAPVRNIQGPAIAHEAVVWGILYTNGGFDSTGNAQYYGSVVTKEGVGEFSPSAGTPDLWWDESLTREWPPDGWELPRVVITKWETDL